MTPLPLGPHPPGRPGSAGEHRLQRDLGTTSRADRFYDDQVVDRLNPAMREFVGRQQMFFLATADGNGACDSTLRAGPPGFLEVLDPGRVAWPELKGNGVMASLGNISENPQVGLLLVDFVRDTVGLHINGAARLVEPAAAALGGLEPRAPAGRTAPWWVVVDVEEAYIHCSKHIPRFAEMSASDAAGAAHRGRAVDYFGAVAARRREESERGTGAAS